MTRRRAATLAALWIAVLLLVAIQATVLWHLMQWNRALRGRGLPHDDLHLLLPADWWRFAGVAVPLFLLLTALGLQVRWTRNWMRGLSAAGFFVALCLGALVLLVAKVGGVIQVDTVRLANGQRYVLAIESVMTDRVYTLFRTYDRIGFVWQETGADLDYSEDFRFVGGESLTVSPDQRWLLVSRAGLWTDCLRLGGDWPVNWRVQPVPSWFASSYEADMRTRSRRIAELTGVAPP